MRYPYIPTSPIWGKENNMTTTNNRQIDTDGQEEEKGTVCTHPYVECLHDEDASWLQCYSCGVVLDEELLTERSGY